MKNFKSKLTLLACLSMVLSVFILSSCEVRNYDGECVVGAKYTIYSPKSDNPFEPQTKASVIIVDKQNGYVQYCWDYDYKNNDKVLFNRSVKEFIEAVENYR